MKEKILKQINKYLKKTQVIFFCRDAERASGLENLIPNLHIFCIEESAKSKSLLEKGKSVFSLNSYGEFLGSNNIASLLKSRITLEKIKDVTNGEKFIAMTFASSKPFENLLKNLNCEKFFSDFETSFQFENKLNQVEIFKNLNLPFPNSEIISTEKVTYLQLSKKFGETFVLQLEKGHTGRGTFKITNETEYLDFSKRYNFNNIKISEFLNGEIYTINLSLHQQRIFISALQKQITGLKNLGGEFGTTNGNNFTDGYLEVLEKDLLKLKENLFKLGKFILNKGYSGLLGIDLIYWKSNFYFIEINARQTANIPFQTELENLQSEYVPLALANFASYLGIDQINYEDFSRLKGLQVLNRNRNEEYIFIPKNISGTYNLEMKKISENLELSNLGKQEFLVLEQGKGKKEVADEIFRIQTLEDSKVFYKKLENEIKTFLKLYN